jgi:hypothetical protein
MKFKIQLVFLLISLVCGISIFIVLTKYPLNTGQMGDLLVPALLAAVGFIGKSLWDAYSKNNEHKINFKEKQLSTFYYPILIRLEKDNVTWQLILQKRKEKDSLDAKIGENIEKEVILPNHDEILKILESNIHFCQNDELMGMFKHYIRHVLVYKAIRASGDNETFPLRYDKTLKWDDNLFPLIQRETAKIQKELNEIKWS